MDAPEDKAKPGQAAREQRLAAKLRENLRKRKAQARGRAEASRPDPMPDPVDLSEHSENRDS